MQKLSLMGETNSRTNWPVLAAGSAVGATNAKASTVKPAGSTASPTPANPKAQPAPSNQQSARSDSQGGTQITINIHPTVKEVAPPKNTPKEAPKAPPHQDSNPAPSKSAATPSKQTVPQDNVQAKGPLSGVQTPSASDTAPADDDPEPVSNSKPARASRHRNPPPEDREEDEADAREVAQGEAPERTSVIKQRLGPSAAPRQATSPLADPTKGPAPVGSAAAALGQVLADLPGVLPASVPATSPARVPVAAASKLQEEDAAFGARSSEGPELLSKVTAPAPRFPVQAAAAGSPLERQDPSVAPSPARAKAATLPRGEAAGPALAVQEAVQRALPRLQAAAKAVDEEEDVAPTGAAESLGTAVPGYQVVQGVAPASGHLSPASGVPIGTGGGATPAWQPRRPDTGKGRAQAEASGVDPVDAQTIDDGSVEDTPTPTSRDWNRAAATKGVQSAAKQTTVAGGEVSLGSTRA